MNVIVLTTGISGSSVITGLLAKSGLWAGDETIFKDNITGTYETYENKKLVELNESLFKEADLVYNAKTRYDGRQARKKFSDLYKTLDTSIGMKYQKPGKFSHFKRTTLALLIYLKNHKNRIK